MGSDVWCRSCVSVVDVYVASPVCGGHLGITTSVGCLWSIHDLWSVVLVCVLYSTIEETGGMFYKHLWPFAVLYLMFREKFQLCR